MKKVLLFVALAVALDFVLGEALDRLFRRTLSGERGGLINLALRQSPEVLILGSSRAQYHIAPEVIEDRAGLRTFNAGIQGHDFLYALMLFDLWRQAHPAPKAIVLHLDLESLIERPNEEPAVHVFAPFVDRSERVREVLFAQGRFEPLKYLSRTYRYNGKVLPILKNLSSPRDAAFDGFAALDGTYDPSRDGMPSVEIARSMAGQPFAARKVTYLTDLAKWCGEHHTRLFLVHSPVFGQDPDAHRTWANRVRDLVSALPATEFMDVSEFTYPTEFAHAELYKDYAHLNREGAARFSSILGDELSKRMHSDVRRVTARRGPAVRVIPTVGAATTSPVSAVSR